MICLALWAHLSPCPRSSANAGNSVNKEVITILCLGVIFSGPDEFDHVLPYHWENKEVHMKAELQTLTTTDSAYSEIRQAVKNKLQEADIEMKDYLVYL
ncbi:hypothetical protein B0H12DRAFT_1122754, partial [Mycena haematopus]